MYGLSNDRRPHIITLRKVMGNERKVLGERIRAIRKIKGFTQEELGERADLNYKYIGEVERV